MSATLDPKHRESSESASVSTVPKAPNSAHELADSVAQKVADVVPDAVAEISDEPATVE